MRKRERKLKCKINTKYVTKETIKILIQIHNFIKATLSKIFVGEISVEQMILHLKVQTANEYEVVVINEAVILFTTCCNAVTHLMLNYHFCIENRTLRICFEN